MGRKMLSRFALFMDFYHAYAVGDNGKDAEPYGNVVVMINIINSPHNKGYDDYPFKPHGVFCVNIPCKHACGDNRDPGDGVCGDGGNAQRGLYGNNSNFDCRGTFPFCNDKVSRCAYKGGDASAVSAEKKMRKGVEQKLKSLHYNVAVFVFNKTDKHHYGAADERNYVAENNVHSASTAFCSFLICHTLYPVEMMVNASNAAETKLR